MATTVLRRSRQATAMAPGAREISILFAALMGAHLLREGDLTRRAIAAVGMVLGIGGLTLG